MAPFVRTVTEAIAYAEVERFYAPDGALDASLREYEPRAEQVRMAFAVAEAFNEGKVAVIEAGTGTGKSLAYLYPAVLWAVRNKERVVVSTNTINLQEQLIKKDIPLLQKAGLAFRAVLVKGRSNYLCLRKLDAVAAEPGLFKDEGDELQAIIAWGEKSADGCRSDLSFIPRDEVWEEVACEADQCGRVKCPFYSRCFFYTARRAAAGADVLVVNHALLMADVAVRQETGYDATAILPPFTRLIFDEGHHLEDTATDCLASQVTRQGLLKLLGKLQNPKKPQRGLLPHLSAKLASEIPEALDDLYQEIAFHLEEGLIPRRSALADAIGSGLDAVGLMLLQHLKRDRESRSEEKLRVTPAIHGTPFWQEAAERLRKLSAELVAYTTHMDDFLKGCDRLPEKVRDRLAGPLIDLKGLKGRLASAVEHLNFFVSRAEGYCSWFEVKKGGKGMTVRLCCAPLEVAETIKSVIIDKFRTVILTSATLAVGERFDYLEERTGIGLVERARVTELLLASPFDYGRQAFVGIPADMPEPTSSGFPAAVVEALRGALAISRGRAFVLFTSYDLLTRIYGRLEGELREMGLNPMRQGEANRHLLLSRFRKGENSVLFATDSFWEGVDVQGRALELVVITRLPFRVPTEPILEARAEHIAARGGDPFMEYTVPQAVIKFKQGFGRLIRSRDDRGAVLILDSRVLTKNYGRIFLRALPDVRAVKGSGAEVLAEMAPFFTPSPASAAGRRS